MNSTDSCFDLLAPRCMSPLPPPPPTFRLLPLHQQAPTHLTVLSPYAQPTVDHLASCHCSCRHCPRLIVPPAPSLHVCLMLAPACFLPLTNMSAHLVPISPCTFCHCTGRLLPPPFLPPSLKSKRRGARHRAGLHCQACAPSSWPWNLG